MIPGAGVDLTDLPLRENLRGKSPMAHRNWTYRCG